MFEDDVPLEDRIYCGEQVKLLVLSRSLAGTYVPDLPYLVISITDPHRQDAVLADSPLLGGILRLRFNDTSHLDAPEIADCYVGNDILMCSQDAENILNFVKSRPPEIGLIICHCEFGISRSAGIAAALSRLLNHDDEFFFANYFPNIRAYNLLLDSAVALT